MAEFDKNVCANIEHQGGVPTWDYTYDVPFDRLDYNMAIYAINLMESINDKPFTQDQGVEVMMSLFGTGKPTDHDLASAVRYIAANLESIPDFDLFDASSLLARLFGRTKERTMDDLMTARKERREAQV